MSLGFIDTSDGSPICPLTIYKRVWNRLFTYLPTYLAIVDEIGSKVTYHDPITAEWLGDIDNIKDSYNTEFYAAGDFQLGFPVPTFEEAFDTDFFITLNGNPPGRWWSGAWVDVGDLDNPYPKGEKALKEAVAEVDPDPQYGDLSIGCLELNLARMFQVCAARCLLNAVGLDYSRGGRK
jgi:hypothetical protein